MTRGAQAALGNVVPFPVRKAGPPPFDPNNPVHVAAWTAMWEAGQAMQARGGVA